MTMEYISSATSIAVLSLVSIQLSKKRTPPQPL